MDEKGHVKFPLYWNRFQKRILNIDCDNFSQYEKVILDYLYEHLSSKKKFLSCTELLKLDTKRAEVLKYFSKFILWFLCLLLLIVVAFLNFFLVSFFCRRDGPQTF